MSTARAQTLTSVPDELEALLKAHIPTSLPVLRRVQSAKYEKRMSSGARIVLVSEDAATDSQPEKFTVAFVDYAGGPDTQMWLYSTLEDDDDGDGDKASDKVYREQLEVLVRELVRLNLEYGKETAYPGTMLLGTLNTRVRRILEGMNRIQPRPTDYYNKWLFRAEALPQRDGELPEGMTWDTATLADCEVVAARTDIPRTPTLLLTLPNQIIRHEDGTPISWAFLGPDGALISLHCEEPYRRRGLAKALGARLMRQGPGDYADDGWSSADVAGDNAGSRGMCMSLNGTAHWEVSWVLLDVTDHDRLSELGSGQ